MTVSRDTDTGLSEHITTIYRPERGNSRMLSGMSCSRYDANSGPCLIFTHSAARIHGSCLVRRLAVTLRDFIRDSVANSYGRERLKLAGRWNAAVMLGRASTILNSLCGKFLVWHYAVVLNYERHFIANGVYPCVKIMQ
jgi:hypothetical protein